mgnify:CR=1 FL=1|jgi:hypothetical protein
MKHAPTLLLLLLLFTAAAMYALGLRAELLEVVEASRR